MLNVTCWQGAKLLGFRISGEPKFDGGNQNFGQGFPKGNPEIARFKHFTQRLNVIRLFIMFSETLKKLGKSEFSRWVSEGNPIIFRNFAPCMLVILLS